VSPAKKKNNLFAYYAALLLFCVLSASSFGFAETKEACPKINLLNDRWPALPPQQPPKLCYATVVADSLSFEAGARVSAVAVANHTEKAEDGLSQRIRALRYGQRHAYYRFSAFGKSLPAAFEAALSSPLCRRNFLDEIKPDEMVNTFSELEETREKRPSEFLALIENKFTGAPPGFVQKLFSRGKENTPLIDLAVDTACEPLALPKNPHFKSKDFTKLSPAEIFAEIQNILKAGHGVGVGYDFSVLENPTLANREKAQHASTVVGQGWNDSKARCEYVLRLTELETCALVKSPAQCAGGIVTVPRSDFVKAVSEITWLYF
jgi:hypothetical protein